MIAISLYFSTIIRRRSSCAIFRMISLELLVRKSNFSLCDDMFTLFLKSAFISSLSMKHRGSLGKYSVCSSPSRTISIEQLLCLKNCSAWKLNELSSRSNKRRSQSFLYIFHQLLLLLSLLFLLYRLPVKYKCTDPVHVMLDFLEQRKLAKIIIISHLDSALANWEEINAEVHHVAEDAVLLLEHCGETVLFLLLEFI